MALAGHNRGKKFVPGVGYVRPKQDRVTINVPFVCGRCGKVEPDVKVLGADGTKQCGKCFDSDVD